MSNYTAKLSKVAAGVLAPGEELLAGVRCMRKGATKGIVGGIAGTTVAGAAGSVVASRLGESDRAEGAEQVAAAGLPALPPQIALGLTDRRLLVFKRSTLTGAAKELIGEIARDRIAQLEADTSGSKVTPNGLAVHLVGGGAIEFEVVRGDPLQEIVDAFGAP